MRTLLIVLITSLLISACGMTESPTGSEVALVIPTPSQLSAVDTPAVAPIEEAEVITVTPEPDLLLGVTDRGMNCPLISQIVAHLLTEEAGLSVRMIEYESAEALFAALAASDQPSPLPIMGEEEGVRADLTFCFLDPADRSYLKRYPTDLKQIGEPIWHAKGSPEKLLIMVNSAVFVDIHEKDCAHDLLHDLRFDDASFEEQEVEPWLETHRELVESWGGCH